MSYRKALKPIRSLAYHAWFVFGPRDFFINLTINGFLPWWITRGMDSVPIFGDPSIMSIVGPMGLFMTGLTSFFGVLNGATAQQGGRVGRPLPKTLAWVPVALRLGVVRGLIGFAVFVGVIWLIGYYYPDLSVPRWWLVVFQGTLAAVLAYFVQVSAVFVSGEL